MKVVIAAGGSGGHIFPAVATASELKKTGIDDICFISSKRRIDKRIMKGIQYRAFFLSVNPMPFGANVFKWIVFFVKLAADVCVSLCLLVRLRPSVVVGFGGYSAGTVVRCAALIGIPVIVHEQNLYPGRANKMVSNVADGIAVSFRETAEYFADVREKVVLTGNPIRLGMLSKDKAEALRFLGLSCDLKTVLIMGGSQGSTFLNSIASQAAEKFSQEYEHIQFIHLTGKADQEDVEKFYKERGVKAKVYAFVDRIDMVYAACDMAISRSGAAAIFELAYYARPMILVPYPNPRNSQRTNAMSFSQAGAAVYMEENDLTVDILADEIEKILMDSGKYQKMSENASRLARIDAGKKLAENIVKIAAA
jgi:UDP-N-acetylglucosamine--N-acetylmuramyl-(pentapeptide) pyrophosphoryl-undecaprenol N-acetylglucosamine transferase